jgi:hypothetical protein
MSSDKTPGEFMIAVFPLIREPLLQPSWQLASVPTLRLRQTLRGLLEFLRMGNRLACGEGEQ